jgi:hypothetical protein
MEPKIPTVTILNPNYRTGKWVKTERPAWHKPFLSLRGEIMSCCGSLGVHFGSTYPHYCPPTTHDLSKEGADLKTPPGKQVPCPNAPTKEQWEAWMVGWLTWWHKRQDTKVMMIGILTESQRRAWMPFLSKFGWKITAKHINGNHGSLLYVIIRSNQPSLRLGVKEAKLYDYQNPVTVEA